MNIALVDNDVKFLDMMRLKIENYFQEHPVSVPVNIFTFTSPQEFMECYHNNSKDEKDPCILFSEISFPEISGIEIVSDFLEKHEHAYYIVYCSAINNCAAESYGVNASYYLQKPINDAQLERALNKVSARWQAYHELRLIMEEE